MSSLSVTRSYDDGEVLVRSDLDAFLDDIETFINVTKINDDNIQNSGITGSTKLLNQSVTAAKLAADAVETLKILDGAVTAPKIAADAVTTAKILDANVTAAKLATDSVTTIKIVDSNVTTAKIADANVTTAKILDANVTTAKINDSAVTTGKINDGAVTGAKKSTNYALTTISTDATWTNGEAKSMGSIAASGRPIRLLIYEGNVTISSDFQVDLEYSSDNSSWSAVKRVFTNVTAAPVEFCFGHLDTNVGAASIFRSQLEYIHAAPTVGTAYYRLRVVALTGTCEITVALKTLVEEL